MIQPKKPTEKKYFLIYARKSSEAEDRQVSSIPDQLNELKTVIDSNNLEIIDPPFTEAQSAKAPGRKEFAKMIELIDSRKDIKGIIVWKLDRLFRNPKDEGEIRQFLSDGRIEEIITPSKTYYEADSDFIMAVEGAQAQRFIRDLRQNTARGINSKLTKGIAPILAPPGYRNAIEKKQGERDIQPHPIQFPLMRKVFELFLTGNYSIAGLHEEILKLGIKSSRGQIVSKTQLSVILHNPFYTGTRFIFNHKLYSNGIHKPMITDAEYDRIQDILEGNSRPRGQVNHSLLTGLITCGECNMSITSEIQRKRYKNGTTQEIIYYRCTKKNKEIKCNQKYIRAEELERQANLFLKRMELSPRFVDWAIKWLKEKHKDQGIVRDASLNQAQQAYNEVIVKLGRVVDLMISGVITPDEGTIKKQALEEEKGVLSDKLSQIDTHVSEWTDLAIQTFDFITKVREKFKNGTIEQRKTILRVIGSNLILKDKILTIEARTPFMHVQRVAEQLGNKSKLTSHESIRAEGFGVEDGVRTRDIQLHKLALYH